MTSLPGVMAAFAIILLDLMGRAGLDKVLALTGGPAQVALWAQLQSVVELVSSVAIAGVLQGLTVLVSRSGPRDEFSLLREALKLALYSSLAVALFAPMAGYHLSGGKIAADLFWLAALSGCITVIPATVNAYWLGKHQQPRMLGLALLAGAVLLLVALGAWLGLPLHGLLLVQCFVLLLIGGAIWFKRNKLYRRVPPDDYHAKITRPEYIRQLGKFVPVGLAIGIMSPVSVLLVRGMLSDTLSWDEVGYLQALWRSTEWVTATAAGVLSLVFLPRMGNTCGTEKFNVEIWRAAAIVLIPAACLLLLIYLNQRVLLATLYDARFAVSDQTAALFMLGSWVRIAAWIFLFGLFAANRTWLIVVGEILSLPLYALLLWLFADGMTLERTALLYLVSYLAYLAFNAIALTYPLRTQRA